MSGRFVLQRLEILRRYIPENLFAEAKLPQIRIYREGKRDFIAEDPSLVISAAGYLPGKPTYRERTGLFIPLTSPPSLSKDVKPIITDINGYYSFSGEPIHIELSKTEQAGLTLPDEYQYVVKEILRKGHVDARTIDSIHIKSFECREYDEEHRRLFHRWLFYPHVRHNFTCDEISKKYKFYTYLDLSNSFPRFFIYQFQTKLPVLSLKIPCGPLREIIRDEGIRLYKNSDVYFGIYAIDVNANIKGPFCKERNEEKQGHCIVADTIEGSDSRCRCVEAQGRRYFNNFVKVLIRSVKDGLWDPVTIGYKINNTRVLEINLNDSRIIQEQFERIMRRINDDRSRKLEPSYYELSINTALVNSLRHILTSDLPIVYYFELMGSVKTADLIKLAFLHHELRSSVNITELIYNVDNAKPIIDIVRNFINNYNNDNLALLLRYFMSKLRRNYKLITLFMGGEVNDSNLLQKVSDRLQNILNKYKKVWNNDWKFGAIFDLVKHTFSHHLIRTMSTRGGVMAGKFLEQYEELSKDPIEIVEKDSGGIGVMREGEYILDIWKNGETLVEDLLLSLGKCLIGTPEDLIHFAIVKRENELSGVMKDDIKPIKELTRLFKQVADDLGIIVTPDELKETVKQWLSVFEEATRIGKLIGESAFNILWEIHSIRYDFERKYRRFPDFDELIIYTVMVISKYPTLRKLIRVLLRRALSQRNLTNVLRNLYGAENSEERFIDDVSSMLETLAVSGAVRNTQKYILDCLMQRRSRSNQSIDNCEGVISSLVLLRKVITSVLTHLALLSCNGACGMCYVNSRSCGRFGAPFIQARTLDRRLLKILASMIIEKVGKAPDGELAYSNGAIVEFRGRAYSLGCGG
jgi:hypothetical protein